MEFETMMENYISVVIPAYNCELYLERCLESVINQTFDKLEIILINDGSTDCTAEICKVYASKDSRIRYIEQTNYGVAYTRRKGIENATGQYIGFVDADDYIDEDMYEKMLLHIPEAQLVTSGYLSCEGKIFDLVPEGLYRTQEEKEYLYENMLLFGNTCRNGITSNLWSKLFVTRKLRSVVEKTARGLFIGEDADVLFRYILQCEAVYVSKICCYHYEIHCDSIMHSININYLRNVENLYYSLSEEFAMSSYSKILMPKWNSWVWLMLQRVPRFMGWDLSEEHRPIKYLSNYINRMQGSRIVLYGAGAVGKDFYRLYQKMKDMNLVLWVDRNWIDLRKKGWNVWAVEQLYETDYEYVLLAVRDERMAQEIRAQLMEHGVRNSDILWSQPIRLDEL